MTATLETHTLTDSKLGIVTVQVTAYVTGHEDNEYGGLFSAVGSAKANSEDPFDPQIGAGLALSRALKSLSRQIARDVHDEVHTRDKVRQHQQETAQAAQERARRRRG